VPHRVQPLGVAEEAGSQRLHVVRRPDRVQRYLDPVEVHHGEGARTRVPGHEAEPPLLPQGLAEPVCDHALRASIRVYVPCDSPR